MSAFDLTYEKVNSDADSMSARCNAIVEHLQEQKSVLGIFGGNEEIYNAQQSIRDIQEVQISKWRELGKNLVDQQESGGDITSKAGELVDIEKNILTTLDDYDGLGKSLSVSTILDKSLKTAGAVVGGTVSTVSEAAVKPIVASPTLVGIGIVAIAVVMLLTYLENSK